jgi:hypothetical protein
MVDRLGVDKMRSVPASVLALGMLIAFGVSANAAPIHRPRARPHATVSPNQVGATAPTDPAPGMRFAVPGWSNDDTQRWLDKASSLVGVGG